MTIQFPCGRCGKENAAEHDWVGRQVLCGRCGAPITVPYPKPKVLDAPIPATILEPDPVAPPAPAAGVVRFRCGSCATRNEADRALAGETVQCGSCGAWLLVPGAPARPRAPQPTPAASAPTRPPGSGWATRPVAGHGRHVPSPAPRDRVAPVEAWPRRPAPPPMADEGPVGWLVFGILGIGIVLGAIGVLATKAGLVMALIIGGTGVCLMLAGAIWTYSIAYNEEPSHGLRCLTGFYSIYYQITRWPATRQPFLCWAGGFGLLLFAVAVYFLAAARAAKGPDAAEVRAIAEARAADKEAAEEAFAEPGRVEPIGGGAPAAGGVGAAGGVAVELPDPPAEPDLIGLDQIETDRRLDAHRAAVRAWLDDCWQRLRRTYNDDRVVTVTLRGISDPDALDPLVDRLRANLQGLGLSVAVGQAYKDGVRAVAGPVADPAALAARIDLGVTVAADVNNRDLTLTLEKNPR